MRAEPDYAAEMRLPAGKTCADCIYGAACDGLFGGMRQGFMSCDFYPSRYRQITPEPTPFSVQSQGVEVIIAGENGGSK